jgi:hypothetical protein
MPSNELHRNQFALRAKSTGFHCVIAPRWKSISIQSNIVRHLRDIPRDTHVAKIADYDDTALGTGTLTVHPWRAGPDCGKIIKGQLISKCPYEKSVLSKIPTKKFPRFLS